MEVLNINSVIRNELKNNYDKATLRKYYNDNKDCVGFYYIAGVLYINAYIVNYYIFKHTLDENAAYVISVLESYDSIYDFMLDLTEERFLKLCANISYFEELDLFSKKEFMYESISERKNLEEIFPIYLMDILYYLRPNVYEALDRYYENYSFLKNKKLAFNDTIVDCTEDLINLEEEDPDSFKYVMLDMIKIYYKYRFYLCMKHNIKPDNSFYLDKIEEDLDSFLTEAVGNDAIISQVIQYYLYYNLLSQGDKKMVDDYYEKSSNKKKLQKVLKKCDELYYKN